MSKKRVHLFVKGRVQGVFFRACTQDEAQKRMLTGWVRNLHDGRVEALFEGEEKDVQSMIAWCHRGPSHAVVTDVSVELEEYMGEYSGFSVTTS